MMWRRTVAAEASLDASFFASPMGEGAMASPRGVVFAILRSELGWIAIAFAAVGAVIALRTRASRSIAASLVAIATCGAVTCAFGAPAGPVRFGGGLLATIASVSIFCAYGMACRGLRRERENSGGARERRDDRRPRRLAVPVRVADDASLAMSKRDADATTRWNARVFGSLPKNAVLLLPTPRLFLRARAAHAAHALADDVIVIPTFGLGSRAMGAIIAREPLCHRSCGSRALRRARRIFSFAARCRATDARRVRFTLGQTFRAPSRLRRAR